MSDDYDWEIAELRDMAADEMEELRVRIGVLEKALNDILQVYEIEPAAQQIARKALRNKLGD